MAELRSRWPLSEMVIYALLPLLVLGGVFAGLIAFGVIPLISSPDRDGVLDALFLGPVGVLITGNDSVELSSEDSRVTVTIPAGTISTPALLSYQEADLSGTGSLPQGYLSTGWSFELSAQSERAADGPVRFQQMFSITVGIGPEDLELAGNDYSRFALQHYREQERSWDVLETIADPSTSNVVAYVDRLSQFALTIGPASNGGPAIEPSASRSTVETLVPRPVPVSTADGLPVPSPSPAQIPEQQPTSTPNSTPSEPPTRSPNLAPAATLESTIVPRQTATGLHGFRLYINGRLINAGQTRLIIPNGAVVLHRPPDADGTYPPDSIVRLFLEPDVPGSAFIMAGFITENGQVGDV